MAHKMETDTPLTDDDEKLLFRRILAGIVIGWILIVAAIIIVAAIAVPERSGAYFWGVGIFAGIVAGLFFGGAAGAMYHLLKTEDH